MEGKECQRGGEGDGRGGKERGDGGGVGREWRRWEEGSGGDGRRGEERRGDGDVVVGVHSIAGHSGHTMCCVVCLVGTAHVSLGNRTTCRSVDTNH